MDVGRCSNAGGGDARVMGEGGGVHEAEDSLFFLILLCASRSFGCRDRDDEGEMMDVSVFGKDGGKVGTRGLPVLEACDGVKSVVGVDAMDFWKMVGGSREKAY